MQEKSQFPILAVRSTAPHDSPRPAIAGSDTVEVQEWDPPLTDVNPRFDRLGILA
jgi:hypothetical protein